VISEIRGRLRPSKRDNSDTVYMRAIKIIIEATMGTPIKPAITGINKPQA
jgi:hypothetical protein